MGHIAVQTYRAVAGLGIRSCLLLSSVLFLTFMTTRLFQFRFADAEQYWLITFTFFRCQRMKQSAATGILNGLALDYLSTIFLIMGLDIMFLIAYRCVACSVRHWELWACLAHCRQFLRSVQVEFLPVLLRHWCRGSNSGYMLRDTCRGYSLHKPPCACRNFLPRTLLTS